MLIAITEKRIVKIIQLQSESEYRVLDELALDEILEDFLSISWDKMSMYIEEDDNIKWSSHEGPFINYEAFNDWLKIHDGLSKDKVNNVTFEIMKTQFPIFSKSRWKTFYNTFLYLDKVDYFLNTSKSDGANIFFQMYPKQYYFSPSSNKDNLNDIVLFSSNIEMLFWDIFSNFFEYNNIKYSREIIKTICKELISYTQNPDFLNLLIKGWNFTDDGYPKLQDRIESILRTIIFGDNYDVLSRGNLENFNLRKVMTLDDKIHLHLVLYLLNSPIFKKDLIKELETNQHGQKKIPIEWFLDNNLELSERLFCQEYIYNCYKKYEIADMDIFEINEVVNPALLLGAYAGCIGKTLLQKCSICNRYYIGHVGKQCNQCAAIINQNKEINDLKNEALKFRQNMDTNHKRLNSYAKNSENKYNDLFEHCKNLKGKHDLLNKYYSLLSIYNDCISKAINNLEKSVCYKGAEANYSLDAYLIHKTISQKDEVCSFNDLYKDYLVQRKLFAPFFDILKLINKKIDITKNSNKEYRLKATSSFKELAITFDKINSCFAIYAVNTTNLKNTQLEILNILVKLCEENDIPNNMYCNVCNHSSVNNRCTLKCTLLNKTPDSLELCSTYKCDYFTPNKEAIGYTFFEDIIKVQTK